LNIFNAKKSVDVHVKKSITLSFSTESNYAWQIDVERFSKYTSKISN